MFWTDDKDNESRFVVPDDVLDLIFAISCKCLPVEHAHALHHALREALPWLDEEEHAGIYPVYGAESGNGWQRPDATSSEIMHLSRRQKMILRMPKERLADAEKLTGITLDIAGYPLTVGKMSTRLLSDLPTLFARYVIVEEGSDENQFLQAAAAQLETMGITVRKMMAGIERHISTPEKTLTTRSLMLADLEHDESVRLQQFGLGPHRKLGCGLFSPQKGITTARPDA